MARTWVVQKYESTNFYVAKQSLMRDVSEYVETEKKLIMRSILSKWRLLGIATCVYVKYLYKGTRLCNYEAIKLQFLCQNISCIDPAKYGIRSFFKCLRSQKGKDYMRNQDQGITVFLSCNKSYLRFLGSLIARKYIQDQYFIIFLSG